MASMKYPVKVLKVSPPETGVRPELIREFEVMARTVDGVRQLVQKKIKADAQYDIRSLSFSPDPMPNGSVVVYVVPTRHRRQR